MLEFKQWWKNPKENHALKKRVRHNQDIYIYFERGKVIKNIIIIFYFFLVIWNEIRDLPNISQISLKFWVTSLEFSLVGNFPDRVSFNLDRNNLISRGLDPLFISIISHVLDPLFSVNIFSCTILSVLSDKLQHFWYLQYLGGQHSKEYILRIIPISKSEVWMFSSVQNLNRIIAHMCVISRYLICFPKYLIWACTACSPFWFFDHIAKRGYSTGTICFVVYYYGNSTAEFCM